MTQHPLPVESFDLFPTHLKIFVFEDDPALNQALLRTARAEPELNASTSGKSVLARPEPWVERLRGRFDRALRCYLKGDTFPARADVYDIEAYAFFDHATGSSFTPVHDHLVEADLVAIYYARAPERPERHDTSYYAMDGGLLVLHDPRLDARTDRRGRTTRDHFRIYPRTNRMVVLPAGLRHSTTPSAGDERLAVTCTVTVNRKDLFEGYVRYRLS